MLSTFPDTELEQLRLRVPLPSTPCALRPPLLVSLTMLRGMFIILSSYSLLFLSSLIPFLTLLSFRQGIAAYCILRAGHKESPETEAALRAEIRRQIGPFANPDLLIFTTGLPKTRSGKIMRRILRKIAAGETSAEALGGIFNNLNNFFIKNYLLLLFSRRGFYALFCLLYLKINRHFNPCRSGCSP